MLTYADVCCRIGLATLLELRNSIHTRMLTYADVCCRIGLATLLELRNSIHTLRSFHDFAALDESGDQQVYAHVCSRMLTYADVC
jgi:hypothetical protein